MLTKAEVREAFIDALKSDEGQTALLDAMAKKLELTAGWDCRDPNSRLEIRKDMEFLREIRVTARRGAERIFFWLLGILGLGLVALIGFKPEIWK